MLARSLVGCVLAIGCHAAPERSSDPHIAWLHDYATLRDYTTRAFANFEYRVHANRIDLRALDTRTRQAIAAARSVEEARAAIKAFVAAFHDGHFRVDPVGHPVEQPAPPIDATATAVAACRVLVAFPPGSAKIGWTALPAFTPLPAVSPAAHRELAPIEGLEAGWLATPAGPVGVLRIAVFMGAAYRELCMRAWQARTSSDACGAECQDALASAMDELLFDEVAARIEALATRSPRALLIDLTANGGGSEIGETIARALATHELRHAAFGYIRDPHWVTVFADAAKAFRTELARHRSLPPAQRTLLEHAAARAEAARADAATRCDLADAWRTEPPQFRCSILGRFEGYGDTANVDVASLDTHDYFGPGAAPRSLHWPGPVWLLVDRKSASATEQVAAMLQDFGGAPVLGETTFGAGCGYTNGGTHVALPALGLVAKAPDCVRYRADGSTESAGVRPTIAVDWQPADDPAARARRVVAALPP